MFASQENRLIMLLNWEVFTFLPVKYIFIILIYFNIILKIYVLKTKTSEIIYAAVVAQTSAFCSTIAIGSRKKNNFKSMNLKAQVGQFMQ